jgi:hypothetical protein
MLVAVLLCAAASLVLAACAGELPNKSPGTTVSTAVETSDSDGSEGSGSSLASSTSGVQSQVEQLSDKVISTWVESMQRLVVLLEGTPPISSVQTGVSSLKEEYVQKMVALGRQVKTLDPSDQQLAYDRVDDKLSAMGEETWFVTYETLYEHYAANEDEVSQQFAVQLSSFNTLTQYAFFEVLRANDPDEATRLGV